MYPIDMATYLSLSANLSRKNLMTLLQASQLCKATFKAVWTLCTNNFLELKHTSNELANKLLDLQIPFMTTMRKNTSMCQNRRVMKGYAVMYKEG